MSKSTSIFAAVVLAIIAAGVYASVSKSDTMSEQIIIPNQTQTTNTMIATFTTNKGIIKIELLPEQAPKTVENFAKLANEGFYNGTRFHRVIADFMIQGGDPLSKDLANKDQWGYGGPGYTFADEIGTDNDNAIGTIAMANSGPNTNGSQFFINTVHNTHLNTMHTVFGNVIEGMDVVHAIEHVAVDRDARPLEDVIVESITIE